MEFQAISKPKRWFCESAALNMPANLENSAVATGLEKIIFIPISKKGNAKNCSNYCTIAHISQATKVVIKILQQYVNYELPDAQAGFRKGRRTRDQVANIRWIIKKARSSRKTSASALLTMLRSLCRSQQTGKFFKIWEYQTILPASWEICMQVKKQQLEPDIDQQTGSKLEK